MNLSPHKLPSLKHPPEEICEDLFRLRIPLPETPLKYLNAYAITSGERNLVIDVGLNLETCRLAMLDGLASLGIALKETDFFSTHMHADHLGLLPDLVDGSSTVYFNEPEALLMSQWKGPGDLIRFSVKHGFPEGIMEQAFNAHPAGRLRMERFPVPTLVKDGDVIEAGPYHFQCVHTPGHTPGHICLYDPTKRIFIAGDHLLGDISPNVVCWADEENPLGNYLESLDKVAELDVDLVLPGHRSVFRGHRRRVAQLKKHHDRRLREVRDLLKNGQMSAFETAQRMSWEFGNGDWDAFPVTQQWFATGEALAHLRYLEASGVVQRQMDGNVFRFQRVIDPL